MSNFKQNNIVKIITDNPFWKGRIGKVVDVDNDQIEVKFQIDVEDSDSKKTIIQFFSEDELEESSEDDLNLNESLKNVCKKINCFFEYYDVMEPKEFDSLMSILKIENNSLLSYGIDEKVVMCLISKSEFVEVLWQTDLATLLITESGKAYAMSDDEDMMKRNTLIFTTIDDIKEILKSNFLDLKINEKYEVDEDINKNIDYINDYIMNKDSNENKVDSWYFVDKIAAIENITSSQVISDAIALKYKIFIIEADNFSKFIVASNKCTKDSIYNEYADYLLGDVVVREVK